VTRKIRRQPVAEENPVPSTLLWITAAGLTAFGIVLIVDAIRNQEPASGYTYEPPISLQT